MAVVLASISSLKLLVQLETEAELTHSSSICSSQFLTSTLHWTFYPSAHSRRSSTPAIRIPATSEASRMKIDRNELELHGGGSGVDI